MPAAIVTQVGQVAAVHDIPLPSRAWTIVITFLFGWFGLIPTVMHSNRSALLGHPTSRYWKAFWVTLIAPAVIAVFLYLALFTALLGGGSLVAGTSGDGDVGSAVVADDGDVVLDDDGDTAGDADTPAVVSVPVDGKLCPQYRETGEFGVAATGNATTSCPFAGAVRDGVRSELSGWSPEAGEMFVVYAYSPVTEKDYTMQCIAGTPIVCTGGVAAIVLVFGDELEVVRN